MTALTVTISVLLIVLGLWFSHNGQAPRLGEVWSGLSVMVLVGVLVAKLIRGMTILLKYRGFLKELFQAPLPPKWRILLEEALLKQVALTAVTTTLVVGVLLLLRLVGR